MPPPSGEPVHLSATPPPYDPTTADPAAGAASSSRRTPIGAGVAAILGIAVGLLGGFAFWHGDNVEVTQAQSATTAVPTPPSTAGEGTAASTTTAPVATTAPAAVITPSTDMEREFVARWETLTTTQRAATCNAVRSEGVAAVAVRMDAAAPGTVRIEFITSVLADRCSGGSPSITPAAPSTPTAPPVSLDIDFGPTDLSLAKTMCESDYNVPVCVYSESADAWVPAGTG